MKALIKYLPVIIILISFSSCYTSRVATINSGGFEYERVVNDYIKEAPTHGETFITYNKENENIRSKSNIIQFNLKSKIYSGSPYKASTIKYPYATFEKKLYYTNLWTVTDPLFSTLGVATLGLAIVSVPATFGSSLSIVNDILNSPNWIDFTPYDFTYNKNYKGRNQIKDAIANSNVQLNIDLYCMKNQPMKDTLFVVDFLPEGAKLNSFKIISGKGKLSNVIHESFIKGDREYHVYKLIGKNNLFARKHTNIKIKQNITYQFKEIYFK